MIDGERRSKLVKTSTDFEAFVLNYLIDWRIVKLSSNLG